MYLGQVKLSPGLVQCTGCRMREREVADTGKYLGAGRARRGGGGAQRWRTDHKAEQFWRIFADRLAPQLLFLKHLHFLFSAILTNFTVTSNPYQTLYSSELFLFGTTSDAMATVLPPPSKRQRTDAAERARQQQDIEEIPSDAGSLRIQFFDEVTGLPIGSGPVLVPVANANPKNLELLLNTLQDHVGLA